MSQPVRSSHEQAGRPSCERKVGHALDTTPGGCPGKRAWYNDGRSPVQDGTIPPHKTGKAAWIGMLAEWGVFLLVVHLLSATPLFLIARKLEHPAPIAAFVPFINAWLVVELAGREWYWLLGIVSVF